MKHLFGTSTLIALFFLSACSGSNQFLDEDYKNGNQPGTLSLLTIQQDDFQDSFSDYSFGNLRANEKELFESHLTGFLSAVPNTDNKGSLTQINVDDAEFEPREFDTGGRTLEILAPAQGVTLKEESIESRYVLILDRYEFEQYEELVGGDSYAGHEPEVQPRINFSTKYLIWDNDTGNAVAWGTVDADRRIELDRMDEIYGELLDESLGKMIQRSPFSAGSI